MKLNPDCIRDILFAVEEKTSYTSSFVYKPSVKFNDFLFDDDTDNNSIVPEILESYTDEEILYHLKQCELSNFFTKINWSPSNLCVIDDLSPLGHNFLSDIRSNTNWNKIKNIAQNTGSSSLTALKDIAVAVISEVIKSQFQNP
ncbi:MULTISPECIES: DUF2513 domain-containing protein [Clostridium]|uniref:DUF2513 domain-containing protein n=1 Tax=Clostridium carnis TaxID=1530 RepID=A0ABY6SSB1_9CLOT|nr:DUF2513 domain-containing protein [Clostridium carnis]CAI3543021.1 conserved hypothetical protein [Clostridium neonatale]CAI3561471.1 conserved hypothetical protein [Clostridium neonatale]CAI3562765.1 conserved hypothetical protein [Clostridium neonatale]CAI3583711.1 conserved hypothetical protein [Clostridium neonatale]CAI3623458.1 conserved hypothetical protein [Clostridium neonatale]